MALSARAGGFHGPTGRCQGKVSTLLLSRQPPSLPWSRSSQVQRRKAMLRNHVCSPSSTPIARYAATFEVSDHTTQRTSASSQCRNPTMIPNSTPVTRQTEMRMSKTRVGYAPHDARTRNLFNSDGDVCIAQHFPPDLRGIP